MKNPAFCLNCGEEFDLEIDNPLRLCDKCYEEEMNKGE